jgi:hypothetical protein
MTALLKISRLRSTTLFSVATFQWVFLERSNDLRVLPKVMLYLYNVSVMFGLQTVLSGFSR